MAEAAGALAVRIGADVSDLVSGFRKAGKETEAFGKAITRVGLVVTAAASALALMVKSSADTADELGKLSQKTGVSVEALSALKYAGELADVSLDELSSGLKKLSKNMADAQAGTGDAKNAFAALGISVTDSSGALRSSEEVFGDVADAFAGMKDGAGKAALAMAIFGKSGADLIPMLNAGRAGLKEAADEAARFGVIVSEKSAKQAEEFNDNLTRLKVAAEGWKHSIANVLIPPLIEFQNEMLKGIQIAGGFWSALAMFGTINPFRSIQGNIETLQKDIAALEKGIEKRRSRGWDTSGFEEDVERKKKQIEFLKFQQREAALKLAGPGSEDARDRMARAGTGKEKTDAPALVDPKAAEAQAREIAEIQHRVREEEDARELKQVALTNAERERMEKEALAARLAAIDFEQAEAIRRGEETLAADGQSHSMKLVALGEALRTQEEIETKAHEEKLARVQEFTDAELEALGGKQAIIEKMEGEHVARLAQIRGAGDSRIFKMVNAMREGDLRNSTGYFADLTSGLAQHSRKWFELNKAAGIANAIVSAYEGIALSMSKYPWPYNIAAAAAHAVMAFGQVNAIRSATFAGGGGGAAPSLAGTTPAPAVSPVGGGSGSGGGGGLTTVINLQGDTFGRGQLQELISKLNEGMRDGGRIVLQ